MFNNFDVAFQPIYDTDNSDIFGFEVLLRGNKPPSEIFASAKSCSDIIELDRKTRKLTLQHFEHEDATLFINCHPITFLYDDLLHRDIAQLQLKNTVVIEITEQDIPDFDLLASRTLEFQQLGALIALDDFGTGSSTFELLHYIRPDFIKIDKSFIQSLPDNKDAQILTDFVIKYSIDSGCRLVAEGIEDVSQLQFITYSNIQFAQGFYIGTPLMSREFLRVYGKS
jgi:EAL domain-containing protein (putative c-di-GMP-specific phosphodiesterase class I)